MQVRKHSQPGSLVPEFGWGPDRRRAALALTFDNLGEAAWLEAGVWDEAQGEHFTVAFMPKLIERLGDTRATFFIEAINAEMYPAVLKRLQAAGHEVGVHAWRHEAWARTEPERRRAILRRSLTAMQAIGIEPVGFRPPGPAIPPECYAELKEAGFRYCSDAGEPGVRVIDDLVNIPFQWCNIDAYVMEEISSPARVAFGDPAEGGTVDQWKDVLQATLDAALVEGGQRTVIFHPEWIGRPGADDKLDAVTWLIDRARQADIWVATAGDIADFVEAEQSAVRVS